jgi:myo-inositol-1(or 4)-monophosphatase
LIELLKLAIKAALESKRQALLDANNLSILSSQFKDIKTLTDLRMNEIICKRLAKTGIPILSEEEVFSLKEIPEVCWIIDPLDGTLNFSRKFPCVGISIALLENGIPVLGVIVDVFNNIQFTSLKGSGAWRNGEPIRVSATYEIKDGVLATGFPSGSSYNNEILLNFITQVQEFKKIRAIGTASLMLSYVASGVFDVYYEKDIYIWDVAAGLSLVSEAGGMYVMQKSSDIFKYEILASNKNMFEKAKSLIFKLT